MYTRNNVNMKKQDNANMRMQDNAKQNSQYIGGIAETDARRVAKENAPQAIAPKLPSTQRSVPRSAKYK